MSYGGPCSIPLLPRPLASERAPAGRFVSSSPLMDDATLVSRAVGGDRDSFATIYDRYSGAVLDLCTAVLRDEEEANEATLESFLRAARELVNLRDRSRLRAWLLAVARHEATTRAERRRWEGLLTPAGVSRAGASDGGGGSPEGRAGGADAAAGDDDDPRRMVWDPADELSERDRAILHLHLRHQLDGDDLGAVLGIRPATAAAQAARLRGRTETSVGALLLSRGPLGGSDPTACKGLAAVLDGWDGQFTPAVGGRIDRHAQRCDACREKRAMLLGRLTAMASLPFRPPPPWLRHEVLLRMELAVSPRLLPGWDEEGFPPGIDGAAGKSPAGKRGARGAVGAPATGLARRVAATVAVVALIGAGAAFLLTRDDDGSTVSASGGQVTTAVPTTLRPAVTAAVTAPTTAKPAVVTTVADPSTTAAPATTTPPATTPVATVPPVAADVDPPVVAFRSEAISAYTAGCPYSVTEVTAEVTDESPVTGVAMMVRDPDGVESSVEMSPDGGRWRAPLGEFASVGQAVFWVEAVDAEGNRGRGDDQVLDVFSCE